MHGRGSWILALPLGLLLLLILAVVGWFVAVQLGGVARGGELRVAFDPTCPAAMQAIRDRLDAYGLPIVEDGGDTLVIQLPGLDDDVRHMPAALTAPGALVVTVDDAPVAVHVRHVGVQMALSGQPVTLLTLDVEVPEGTVRVTLDGAEVAVEAVNGGEVQLAATAEDGARALRLASDRSVQLRYPLPCAVAVSSAGPP